MDDRFSFACCPSDGDVNIFGNPGPSPAAFVKNSGRKGCIAMQRECATEGVTLAPGHTSESLYTDLSVARFKPGSATRGPHACHVPDVAPEGRSWYPTRESRNLVRPYFTGALLRNPYDSLPRQVPFPRTVQPSISGDNIVHCRNRGIKHRSGETLNTRTRFIAR